MRNDVLVTSIVYIEIGMLVAECDNALACEEMESKWRRSLAGPAAAGATNLTDIVVNNRDSAVNVVYHCLTRRA